MRIFIVGFGCVGQSFAKLLREQSAALYREHAITPRIVGVADSRGAAVSERGLDPQELVDLKDRGSSVADHPDYGVRATDHGRLIRESDADLLVEASPSRMDAPAGAIDNIKAALSSGMHVVTVNKAPLAVAMPALIELAEYNRVALRFSGTVGGGTPMLRMAQVSALGDEVVRIRGILNGTTNYILSKMHETGADFDAVLAEAVELGYAESDPSADIDGIDAATKVVILANVVLNQRATLSDVAVEGIRGMERSRIEDAAKQGMVLKLIGEVGEELRVEPQLVPRGDALDVSKNLNALSVTLRSSGDITLIGRGAGGVETATAILRDMLDIWQTVGE
jgi:homoserine dehydrogenase